MQPRVTAVLVVRNGAEYLPRTLAALAAQTRRPDSLLVVDAGSSDGSAAIVAEAGHQVVSSPGRVSFGAAIEHALRVDGSPIQAGDVLWLLGHDNAPEPTALAALLGQVEVAPSVAIAGPKLMRWDQSDVIAGFGESMTRLGRSVRFSEDELDQAQHDLEDDFLGLAAGGMLVRRPVWASLGGFDAGLPTVDAGLDLSVRARLAGHRVVGVPAAKVSSAGSPELFGRRSMAASRRGRLHRSAQLHRRMVYAPGAAVVIHWLSLVPLAVLRSIGHLLAKRPGWIGGELASGLRAAFDGTVPAARRNLRATRRVGWAAIAPLRLTASQDKERRAQARSGQSERSTGRPGFFSAGGAWVVLIALGIGALMFSHVADSPALTGGGLLPLSTTVGELWSHVGWTWHDLGAGFTGPSDPFAMVLAVLGTLTFWSPSTSIVVLYLVALPLAAVGAWFCAARFATRGWAPGLAALAWAVAPPFLGSLTGGHLGAVLAHILLPPLLLAIVSASRSWSASGIAAVLFAVVAACAPVLVPALVVGVVAWALARPRGAARVLLTLVPAAVLFAPLIWEQLRRGNLIGLLAEPGVPVIGTAPGAHELALGSLGDWGGWAALLAGSAAAAVAPWVLALLVAPIAVLAVLALFVPGTRRSVPSMVLALLGFLTAVLAIHLQLVVVGSQTATVWAGPGLSLYWLGLLGSAGVAIELFARRGALPTLVTAVAALAAAVPLVLVAATAAIPVQESSGRLLPAFAAAETASDPRLGTLELTAQPDGGIAVTLHRGSGTTLDEYSTLAGTATEHTDGALELAELAGNIASRSGFDIPAALDKWHIAFVLVPFTAADLPGDQGAEAVHQRMTEALDGNRQLDPVGQTSTGLLWSYPELSGEPVEAGPGPTGTAIGLWYLVAVAVVFGISLLAAIPTTRRRRVRSARGADANAVEDSPEQPVGGGDDD
jgi:GT2 family glycosyltransferase